MKKFLHQSIQSVVQSFHGQLDSLSTDESTIEYITDLLSDLEITNDEKQETIQGIFELHLDTTTSQQQNQLSVDQGASNSKKIDEIPKTVQESVQDLIERAHSYLSNPAIHSEEKSSSRASSTKSRSSSTTSSSSKRLSKLREEEEKITAQKIKKAIVDQYGKVEMDGSALKELGHSNGKSKEMATGKFNENSSEDEVPKDLLDQELKLLDMKKRHRKKIESKKYVNNDDMLLRPNLNSKLVDHENKLKKQELSEKNKLKIQKDKADLIKQRENQEKKKTEARLKARKLERRA